jgi:hypothetical protein
VGEAQTAPALGLGREGDEIAVLELMRFRTAHGVAAAPAAFGRLDLKTVGAAPDDTDHASTLARQLLDDPGFENAVLGRLQPRKSAIADAEGGLGRASSALFDQTDHRTGVIFVVRREPADQVAVFVMTGEFDDSDLGRVADNDVAPAAAAFDAAFVLQLAQQGFERRLFVGGELQRARDLALAPGAVVLADEGEHGVSVDVACSKISRIRRVRH